MARPPGAKGPRGEIAELSASLQNLCTAGKRSDKELRMQKRDVFKKVINYLTVGMDMSSLFPSMTSCANLSPDDLVLKKMLYLYITHYATQTPDLALLTINQLHKDCVDQDPLVRGLALRSLCSLRLPNFLEYVSSPVLQGLTDRDPYVRRTAVMGVLKIYHIDPAVVEHTGMLETVRRMLQTDSDPQVIANGLTVLLKVTSASTLLDKTLIYNLVNKIKEFSDWGQCQVLDLVGQYNPTSETEVYDILNALEDRLSCANSAVALAATKSFLLLTLAMPATHQQVLERIKEPLKSIIGRDEPAINFAVLANVLLLAQRAPVIFENDYTTFYCRTHDPWYVKKLKIEILSALASCTNVYDIVTELTEYARDVVHPKMAREAVRAVGRIALAVPDVAGTVERLLIFLESGCDAVVCEALVVMKDLLRRFPDIAEVVVAQVMTAAGQQQALSSPAISEPAARAALLWIMGQFGQYIPEAPYLLEPLLETFSSEEDCVRLAALTAAAQLFFKRPPECRLLLGKLLVAGLADSSQDVHDRALLYYRLLRTNVAEAERIINPPLMAVMAFSEALTPEQKDQIFQEFNTLSVVYQAPSSSFLDHQGQSFMSVMEAENLQPNHAQANDHHLIDNATNLLDDVTDDAATVPSASQQLLSTTTTSTTTAITQNVLDLLDIGDSNNNISKPPSSSPTYVGLNLDGLSDLQHVSSPAVSAPPAWNVHAAVTGNGTGSLGGGNGGAISLLGSPTAAPPPSVAPVAGAAGNTALFDIDSMFTSVGAPGGGGGAAQLQPAELHLDPNGKLAAKAFQDKWKTLAVSQQITERLTHATVQAMAANNHRDFCNHLTQACIQTTASGGTSPLFKYYFYGVQAGTDRVCMVEMVVSTVESSANIVFKSELSPALTQSFVELFSTCLTGFYR